MSLKGQIAVVTGASRGIEITERGGKGVAAYVDHSIMEEVKHFFERIEKDHNGQLDILVNNAFSAAKVKALAVVVERKVLRHVEAIVESEGKKFYECPPEMWDEVNNVGLRNHYYCSIYAARLMAKNGKGLIVSVSSPGGSGTCLMYRMNVCVVSLWPGAVRTEFLTGMLESKKDEFHVRRIGCTKLFKLSALISSKKGNQVSIPAVSKAVVALASDDRRMEKSGLALITADLGNEYGFQDTDGRDPPSMRSVSFLLNYNGYKQAAQWVPAWVKVPGWLLWASASRL